MLKLGLKSENASRWDRALYFDGCVAGWDSAAKPPSLRAPPVHKLPSIHHRQTPALESQHRRARSVQIVPKTRALTKFFVMLFCRILTGVYQVWNHSIFWILSLSPSLKYKHLNNSGPDLFPKKLF